MDNLESVKSTAESNLKMRSIANVLSSHAKEILQKMYKSLLFVSKLKNEQNDFPYFP